MVMDIIYGHILIFWLSAGLNTILSGKLLLTKSFSPRLKKIQCNFLYLFCVQVCMNGCRKEEHCKPTETKIPEGTIK